MRLLEAKVEYLLDEVYALKSTVRLAGSDQGVAEAIRRQQIESFDYQWGAIPYHDMFLSNPAWREMAEDDICHRLELPREWFQNKRVLDCGCGPARYSWAFAKLGAHVTAFDTSDAALLAAKRYCEGMDVVVDKQNILSPLPYDSDYDLVWCYGVIHCTGDTFAALRNIVSHLKTRRSGVFYGVRRAQASRG